MTTDLNCLHDGGRRMQQRMKMIRFQIIELRWPAHKAHAFGGNEIPCNPQGCFQGSVMEGSPYEIDIAGSKFNASIVHVGGANCALFGNA